MEEADLAREIAYIDRSLAYAHREPESKADLSRFIVSHPHAHKDWLDRLENEIVACKTAFERKKKALERQRKLSELVGLRKREEEDLGSEEEEMTLQQAHRDWNMSIPSSYTASRMRGIFQKA